MTTCDKKTPKEPVVHGGFLSHTPVMWQWFVNVAAGLFLHFVAGAVPAVPASHLSHVALDAASVRGVPLLVRRF
jgi:hypothetical protein